MSRRLQLIWGASTAVLLGACATAHSWTSPVRDFGSVFQHPSLFDDQWITVRGYIGMDGLGHAYLFSTLHEAQEKKFANSIDIIAGSARENAKGPLKDLACAEIYGKFGSYENRITTDYLLSSSGSLTIALISACPNTGLVR